MHPFCRSTTIADFGGDTLAGMERRARDKDGNTVKVPADMTYGEWYRRFVANSSNNGLTKPSASGTIDIVEAATGAHMGIPISIVEAVIGANPNYSSDYSYQVNCQRCVQAYELRRRGYDVIAKPMPANGNKITWGSECFIQPGQYNLASQAFTLNLSESDIKNELTAAPDGARYIIYVNWKGRGTGAHVFIAEKENGVVRYVDPQTGNMDVSDYFSKGIPNEFGYFRTDDKAITIDTSIINATVEVKKP